MICNPLLAKRVVSSAIPSCCCSSPILALTVSFHMRTGQAPVVMPCAVSCYSFLWLPWGLRKVRSDRATVAFRSLGIAQVFAGLRRFPSRCRHGFSFLSLLAHGADVNKKRNRTGCCAYPVEEG